MATSMSSRVANRIVLAALLLTSIGMGLWGVRQALVPRYPESNQPLGRYETMINRPVYRTFDTQDYYGKPWKSHMALNLIMLGNKLVEVDGTAWVRLRAEVRLQAHIQGRPQPIHFGVMSADSRSQVKVLAGPDLLPTDGKEAVFELLVPASVWILHVEVGKNGDFSYNAQENWEPSWKGPDPLELVVGE